MSSGRKIKGYKQATRLRMITFYLNFVIIRYERIDHIYQNDGKLWIGKNKDKKYQRA